MNPPNEPIIGFLHPSEMTPEERTEELTTIFAAGFLHLRTGVWFPKAQAQTTVNQRIKSQTAPLTHLEKSANPRLCGSQTESIP
jgi:hypothetical protein